MKAVHSARLKGSSVMLVEWVARKKHLSPQIGRCLEKPIVNKYVTLGLSVPQSGPGAVSHSSSLALTMTNPDQGLS